MRYIVLTILFGGMACSKAQLPTTPVSETRLAVSAIGERGERLDSVKVFLDGEFVGMTPFQRDKVQPGLYALRLIKEGFQLFTEQIEVDLGAKYNVEAVLYQLAPDEGELLVTINQDSAFVIVKDPSDSVVARTREKASTHLLNPGPYIVSGEKIGLSTVFKAIDIVAGKTVTVNLELNQGGTAPTLQFDIAEDTVRLDQAMNLSWSSNAYQVIIDQGVGIRGPNGAEKVICPSSGLKVFTATAYAQNGLITELSDSVFVSPIEVSLDFKAGPDSIKFGDPVLVEWQSDGYQVVIDQGIGVRGPVGREEVYFRNPGKKVFTAVAYSSDNHLTVRKDSVFIKEAPDPILPIVVLSATPMVTVNAPATISWFAQNADYMVVNYVSNAGLAGNEQVTFATTGIRIVTATAYNQAGYSTATDTIEVVEPLVEAVDDIIKSAEATVRADQGDAKLEALRAATVEILTAGLYDVRTNVWYNSGDSQMNESFYIELRAASGAVLLPVDPNAGAYRVIPDDPGEPHTAWRASGIFRLAEGSYAIDIRHYAKISDRYPEYLNGAIDGPESVKIRGFQLSFEGDE